MTEKQHAKLSPSASSRWMACAGSIALIDKCPPQKDSPYAAEGTAAHSLGEQCLKQERDALYFKGQIFKYPVGTFKADDGMCEAVQVYLDEVRRVAPLKSRELKETALQVEERFSLAWLVPGMFGSNDACVYEVETKTLHVFDYKHGMGVVVSPEWSSQLMLYALGAMHSLWNGQTETSKAKFSALDLVKTIRLVIVQPRAFSPEGPVREWELSASELWFWALHVLKPAAEATAKPNAILRAGSHCRFCPALAVCPEQVKEACAVAKADFAEVPLLPSPEQLTPHEIAKVMGASERIASWASECRAYAHGLAERGTRIPGFKLVARRSNRKWVDEDMAESALVSAIGDDAFAPRKILSVAQAEKALKKAGVSPEAALDGLYEKPDKGTTLVEDTDARSECPAEAALDFLEEADFLN